MSDIAAFLTARLDECERLAREAADGDSGSWFMGDKWNVYRVERGLCGDQDHLVVYGNIKSQSEHIACNDPVWVLADIAAKRRIIAECECTIRQDVCVGLAETMLAMLALPYAGHADYEEAWRV